MLSKPGFSWIPFHVVACSSTNPETNVSLISAQQYESSESWESAKAGDFPVEVIVRFHYRIELDFCIIASKRDLHVPEIEF